MKQQRAMLFNDWWSSFFRGYPAQAALILPVSFSSWVGSDRMVLIHYFFENLLY